MSELTDFLLARIAEDEEVAHEAIAMRDSIDFIHPPEVPDPSFVAWNDLAVPAVVVGPERVLAECEAKRRIVEDFQEMTALPKLRANSVSAQGYVFALERVLQLLALPYADHPDYREEWKP